eukprot:2348443-Amphidinium_carterae.1
MPRRVLGQSRRWFSNERTRDHVVRWGSEVSTTKAAHSTDTRTRVHMKDFKVEQYPIPNSLVDMRNEATPVAKLTYVLAIEAVRHSS